VSAEGQVACYAAAVAACIIGIVVAPGDRWRLPVVWLAVAVAATVMPLLVSATRALN
jgi:hypothetical protein